MAADRARARPDVHPLFACDSMAGEALLSTFLCAARVYACVQFGGSPDAYCLQVTLIDSGTENGVPEVRLELFDQGGSSIASMHA